MHQIAPAISWRWFSVFNPPYRMPYHCQHRRRNFGSKEKKNTGPRPRKHVAFRAGRALLWLTALVKATMEGGCGRKRDPDDPDPHPQRNLAAGPGREPEEEEEDPESPFLYKYFPGPPTLSSMGTKEKEKEREGNTAHGNSLAC
jgi:hypothetical protein